VPNEPTASRETESIQRKDTKRDEATASGNSSDVPSLLLVLFSGILAFVAYLQWRSMERQVTIMERQTGIIDGSLRVAQDSLVSLRQYVGLTEKLAESAKASAETATQALHLTERADILIEAVTVSSYPEFTGDTVFRVVFKNFGRTRGIRVEIKSRLLFVPEMKLILKDDRPKTLAAVLGPGKTLKSAFQFVRDTLTQETFDMIASGKVALRFEAEIAYFDVFGKPHHTKASGTFMPEHCRFRVDANQEAD
jgi:hypothetical protein